MSEDDLSEKEMPGDPVVPGEVITAVGMVSLSVAPAIELEVMNTGDRPIQVGSHYHFAEVNDALVFARERAWGRRLAIPSGTSVRFEPGIERRVFLVDLAGFRRVPGLRGKAGGALDDNGASREREP